MSVLRLLLGMGAELVLENRLGVDRPWPQAPLAPRFDLQLGSNFPAPGLTRHGWSRGRHTFQIVRIKTSGIDLFCSGRPWNANPRLRALSRNLEQRQKGFVPGAMLACMRSTFGQCPMMRVENQTNPQIFSILCYNAGSRLKLNFTSIAAWDIGKSDLNTRAFWG
jgi:hypothetical protein